MAGRVWAVFLGQPRTRETHVQALDGLRGLAVLVVILSHMTNGGWLPQPGLSGTGKSGVYLFFVLSAYLLAHAMLARPLAGFADARYWVNYALRRVLRIWPLYLVILLSGWALTRVGVGYYRLDTHALWQHLTLRAGQDLLWSIPVEFTFYLWLPFIAAALAALRLLRGGRWWGLALLALLLLVVNRLWPAAAAPTGGVRLGFYLPVFLCGVGAAWVHRCWPELGRWPRMWRASGWLLLVLLTLTVPALWAVLSGGAFQQEWNHRWFTAFGMSWALLLLAVLWGGGALARFFASAPMRLVGVVSFSVYLWHMPVIHIASELGMRSWNWAGRLPLMLAAMLLVSMLSFLLFERPWRDVRFRGE